MVFFWYGLCDILSLLISGPVANLLQYFADNRDLYSLHTSRVKLNSTAAPRVALDHIINSPGSESRPLAHQKQQDVINLLDSLGYIVRYGIWRSMTFKCNK